MLKMKIAVSERLINEIITNRDVILATSVKDWTDIAAVVVTCDELQLVDKVAATQFGIPTFVAGESSLLDRINLENGPIDHVIDLENGFDQNLYSREIEHLASVYESKVIPPFLEL
jgi:ornithine decarboxylase